MTPETTESGMEYDSWLAGPEGMNFELHPKFGMHDKEDIDKAKAELRRDRDVVSIYVVWNYGNKKKD